MKYLSRAPFFTPPASSAYRDNHEATFGVKEKPCGWCSGTGFVDKPTEATAGMGCVATVVLQEPCPKGCEAPK